MRRLARPLLIALALTLSGCVILPIPIPPRGTQVDLESSKLVVGDTTRTDVHALLGPPAQMPGARFDVWELERDPFHLHWIMLFGGPGYGAGVDFRTGDVKGYALQVEYDESGMVEGWQWRAADGRGQTSGAPALSPPFVPIRRHEWQALQVVAMDDAAHIITTDVPHRLTIERVDLADGQRLGSWTGDPEGCRVPTTLRPGRAMAFGLVDGGLVSVPSELTAAVAPCRWELRDDGTMVPVRLPELAISHGKATAKLAGGRIVRQDDETGLAILSLAGVTVASDDTAAGRLAAVASDATADRLLVRSLRTTQPQPDFRLFELAAGRVVELPALGAAALAGGCAVTLPERLALSPDGRTAALGCAGHVQIWTLDGDAASPALTTVLPTPPGLAAVRMAFSADGGRLVLGPDGIAVWDTADWSLQAFLPGPEAPVHDRVPVMALTPDGSGLATANGFWLLVPSPAEPAR